MKPQTHITLFLLLSLLTFSQSWADQYQDTLKVFKQAGESGNLLAKSYAYALFPTVGKAGIGVGGAFGKGRVYVGGGYVGDTSVSQLSVGFQFGGQAYSQIILFQDQRAFEEFTSGNFEFGAQASAVAITAGASAGAGTSGSSSGISGGKNDATTAGKFHKGMAVFTVENRIKVIHVTG